MNNFFPALEGVDEAAFQAATKESRYPKFGLQNLNNANGEPTNINTGGNNNG